MRDLFTDPAWGEEDLGQPLPDSPFAVSVALPLWRHVVAYEECDPELLRRLRAGYPRFFPPHPVRILAQRESAQIGGGDRQCAIYPNEAAAQRCAAYIRDRTDGWALEVMPACDGRAFAVTFPREIAGVADDYWRYAGEGVSGRQAQDWLDGRPAEQGGAGARAREEIAMRIAVNTGQRPEDVFLFPSGMAAVAAVQRALTARRPGARTAQFDFPYVDVLRVQREIGSGAHFLPSGDAGAIAELAARVSAGEPLAGIYCELPSNPLLRCADLRAIAQIARPAGVPVVADDTVATHLNIDAFASADLVTTSLTKAFSGTGDVLAGSVVVNHRSPLADELRAALSREADTELGGADAVALESNSRDFAQRVAAVNEAAPQLVEWLSGRPEVARVYYPTTESVESYLAVRRDGAGYGGLLSVLLHDAPTAAPRAYDALRCCKGPSLGANFSLACPYTLLAHYGELDWCESNGVSRWLIRFSVGLEGADELIRRWAAALDAAA